MCNKKAVTSQLPPSYSEKNVRSFQYILPKRNQYTRYSNQAPWKSERFGYLALNASRASAAAVLSAKEFTITRYIALSALNAIVE